MGSGINWDEVPPISDSGIDWSKVPNDPRFQLSARERAEGVTRRQNTEDFSAASGGHPLQRVAEGLGAFWPTVGLAAKQAAASLGYGDREELSKEAAEKKRIDAPLTSTFGGAVGKFLPDLGLGVAGGSVGKAGMAMLPSMIRNSTTGAVLNAMEPKEDYSLSRELMRGAAAGVPAEIAGQTAGRAALPFRKQGQGAAENSKILEEAGLPNPLISTRSGENMPRQMSDALEQIPFLNTKLKNSRDQNLEWFTRQQTKDAGMEVPAITDSTRRAMSDRLDDMKGKFNAGANANASNIIQDLQAARGKVGEQLAATGQGGVLNKFDDAIDSLRRSIGTQRTARALTAEDLLERRSLATNAMHSADNAAEREAFRAIRDAYDNAFIAANPAMRSNFERYKAEYGQFKDVIEAADKGLAGDRLIPKNMLSSSEFGSTVAKTPGERLRQAAAEQIAPPPSGWNRAGYIAMLMGAPMGMGGITSALTSPGVGTAIGGLTAASLWNALSRKPVDAATAEAIRQLTSGGVNAGTARFFGQ